MRKPVIRLSVALSVIAVTVAVAGCGGAGVTSTNSDARSRAKQLTVATINPITGPVAASGLPVINAMRAYFDWLNAHGGANGTKIKLTALDNQSQPAVELQDWRQIIENNSASAVIGETGTPQVAATVNYVNSERKIPQLFVLSPDGAYDNGSKYPWTLGWVTPYSIQGLAYGRYLAKNDPHATVAVLWDPEFATQLLNGFKKGIAGSRVKIVATQTTSEAATTVSTQMSNLAASKATYFLNLTAPEQADQAMLSRKQMGWDAKMIVPGFDLNATEFQPVGMKSVQGTIGAVQFKNLADKQWDSYPDVKTYLAAMKKYDPNGQTDDEYDEDGWAVAATFAKAVAQAKSTSPQGLLASSLRLHHYVPPLQLPGVVMNTSPSDHLPDRTVQLQQVVGSNFKDIGKPFTGS